MEITTATLRALQPGAILTVKLRSGRQITGKLKARPTLKQVGQPGIHRVRLEVVDQAKLAGLSDRACVLAALGCTHTVAGDKVVSIDG
jgi:hypothetical protein